MQLDQSRSSDEPGAVREALESAMLAAGVAPSIFNSQPWRWIAVGDQLVLRADLAKQIPVIDPHARLLTLCCGISLHHAYTELAASGYQVEVVRPAEPSGVLARLSIRGTGAADPTAIHLARAAWSRHTDRRPFLPGTSVPAEVIAELTRAAALPRVMVDNITRHTGFLATAASAAAAIEAHNPAYREVLRSWVDVARGRGEGVPLTTIPPLTDRTVPLRDLGLEHGQRLLEMAPGDDAAASYLAIATLTDEPEDWLLAGEVTSAVLLTATHLKLGTSPMSDVVEVPGARVLIRSLLSRAAMPQLVIRVGVPANDLPPPASPRRET